MKKFLTISAVIVSAVVARAGDSSFFQASLTPDIAIHPRTTEIDGFAINIWGENPQHSFNLGIVNGSTGESSGFSVGGGNYADSYIGVEFGIVNYTKQNFRGWQAGIVNISHGEFHGWQDSDVNISFGLCVDFIGRGLEPGRTAIHRSRFTVDIEMTVGERVIGVPNQIQQLRAARGEPSGR